MILLILCFEVGVVQKCKKPVTLLREQQFPRMVKIGLQWFLNGSGACGTTHIESGGFTRSRPGIAHPDIMFHFFPSQVNFKLPKIYILTKQFD